MFTPSVYSLGDDATSATTSTVSEPSTLDKLSSFLRDAAPVVTAAQELVGHSDREKVAILRAKVKNYKRLMNTPPYSAVPGKAWYISEITKMNAQIKALGASVADEADSTRDYSIMRKLTSAGALAGVGIGVAVIYFLVKKANK